MEQYIPVSGVVACHICPRRYYFERSNEHPESPRYTVCKQVSTHLGELLDPERIWHEVLCILPDAPPETRELFDECISACRETAWQRPVQSDRPAVESDLLGIRGRVDKVFEDGTFAITRSSTAPEPVSTAPTGSESPATLPACARPLEAVTGGYVEYVASGICRFVEPQPRDRRAMIRAIRAANGSSQAISETPSVPPARAAPPRAVHGRPETAL